RAPGGGGDGGRTQRSQYRPGQAAALRLQHFAGARPTDHAAFLRRLVASRDDFRRLALAFPGSEERSHMEHPDFRVSGKIFATLGSPDDQWGAVNLFPEQQELAMDAEPEAFKPASGAWGRGGSTLVRLEAV